MDIKRILVQLKQQRRAIDAAIAALERIHPPAQKTMRSTTRSRGMDKSGRKVPGTNTRSRSKQPVGKLIPFRRVRRRKPDPQAEEA